MTPILQSAGNIVTKVSQRLFRPTVSTFPLSTHEIAGPLQFTRGGTFMWFLLGAQKWDFLPLGERTALWDAQAYRYGRLAETGPDGGRPIRIRVTTRPYPSFEYARSLDEDTPSPLPQVEGGESWDDYLAHAQKRLRSTGLDQKLVATGVWIGPVPKKEVREELIAGTEHPSPATLKVIEEMLLVERIMSGRGFSARRCGPRDMAFLLHRSLAMGVPAPAQAGVGSSRWEPSDLAEFTDRTAWISQPFAPTVEIVAETGAATTRRWVAVCTMGAMPEMTWPENRRDPFLLGASRLPFPVECSVSGNLLKGKTIEGAAEFEHNRAEGIRAHYQEHNMTPPPAVHRAIVAAMENRDDITEGDTRSKPRFAGTLRMAVYGRTEDEALQRARDLVDHYGSTLNMSLGRTKDQPQALREFIPGEPGDRVGWQRRLPVRYLAAAMPNVDSELGTPTGPYFAYGSGSARRAARFDMHYGPEVLQAPGLFPITAEPGAGKSVLIGTLAYNAARASQHTIILDPSGPLAKLCDLPELKPFSKVLDLTSSLPGTLSPYSLIPEPTPEQFVDADGTVDVIKFERAKRRASAERQQLMFDVLRMWLPSSLLRLSGTDVILRDAIRTVAKNAKERQVEEHRINPRWVLAAMDEVAGSKHPRAEAVRQIAEEVRVAADFPLGELIMPPHLDPLNDASVEDKTLVVVTMPGLNPPPEGVERDEWGSEERYTQPLLHLAAFFASKFIYGRPRNERKNVFLDENHLMNEWGSGRAFFIRLSRDSRKWNTAVGAASQHPDDHLSIGRIDALMGSAFVGRLTKQATAEKACELLECSEAFAPVIQSLSPRPTDVEQGTQGGGQTGEFVWRDPLGRVGRIRVDMDWHPALRQALVTTPGRPRPAPTGELQPTPFIDPDLFKGIKVVPLEEPKRAGVEEAA